MHRLLERIPNISFKTDYINGVLKHSGPMSLYQIKEIVTGPTHERRCLRKCATFITCALLRKTIDVASDHHLISALPGRGQFHESTATNPIPLSTSILKSGKTERAPLNFVPLKILCASKPLVLAFLLMGGECSVHGSDQAFYTFFGGRRA